MSLSPDAVIKTLLEVSAYEKKKAALNFF